MYLLRLMCHMQVGNLSELINIKCDDISTKSTQHNNCLSFKCSFIGHCYFSWLIFPTKDAFIDDNKMITKMLLKLFRYEAYVF